MIEVNGSKAIHSYCQDTYLPITHLHDS